MKTTARISAPVLAFGFGLVLFTAVLAWWGLRPTPHPKPAPNTSLPISANADDASKTAAATTSGAAEITVLDPDHLPLVIPIPLKPGLVPAENDSWYRDYQYRLIPRGTQDLGGVEFHLDGMIQLQGRVSAESKQRNYRQAVTIPLTLTNQLEELPQIIARGSNVGSVHLLGATRYEGTTDVPIAQLVWRYEDGTRATTVLKFDVHLREWFRETIEQPDRVSFPHSKVVWAQRDPKQTLRSLRLYRVTLANPHRTKTIRSLELVSSMSDPTLLVVGVTLDPLRPGQRPDDSPDLEVGDSISAQTLALSIRTPEDQPIPHAAIRAQFRQAASTGNQYYTRTVTTDGYGETLFKFPAQDLLRLDLTASHEDYGARKVAWDLSTGATVPPSYVLRLGAGVSIGGTVVDATDYPVAGARLNFNRFWSGGDQMNAPGEQADFPSRSITTDGTGAWQMRGLPAEILDRINLRVSHAEFVDTSLTVGGNRQDEARLKAGTHRLVLQRGLSLRGLVVNESDTPLKDARVWAGRPQFTGAQDTRTDAQGRFSFNKLKAGEMQFSVLAKGYQPQTRMITIGATNEDLVLRVTVGTVVRGVVLGADGLPIAGVRISLESPHGGVANDFQHEMTSDEMGRFEWVGAPAETRNFSFLKSGYEARRGHPLAPDQDHVITLNKSRKVEAWVLDADTEQPITKFRAAIGHTAQFNQGERFYPEGPGFKEYSHPNGQATLEISEARVTAIKVETADYAEKIEPLPAARDGVVQVVVRLKPSPSLRGIVVNAQGQPVANASVALTLEADGIMGLRMQRGRFSSYENGHRISTTDAEGRFTLPSPPESGARVAASADIGFGSATVEELRATGRVVLQEFGRIEGTIKIAGQPAAGEEFMFSLENLGVAADWDTHRTKSDSEGRFSFEKVPAGEGTIIRLIRMRENSWRHSHNTKVQVVAGQTTRVAFGETGGVIKGRIRLDAALAEIPGLTFDAGLSTQMPRPTSFPSPEAAQAFYNSAEWRAQQKQMRHYGVSVKADGTFTADGVLPGDLFYFPPHDGRYEFTHRTTPHQTCRAQEQGH
jgi:hypothetical protein